MVLVWFRKRKRPRIYRSPQEAWLDLLAEAEEGLGRVGLVERVQVYANEVEASWFFANFFPNDMIELALSSYSKGQPETLLAAYRGLILYATYKVRFEKFLALTVGRMLAENASPVTTPASVREASTGATIALGTFYGRYPVFTVAQKYSSLLEDDYRTLGLRRMDTATRALFQGYIRWVPIEFGVGEEGGETPKAWGVIPLSRELGSQEGGGLWKSA